MHTSIRTRLLVSFLAIALAAAGGLSLYFLAELEEYALRNLEARLDAEARLTAALLGSVFEESMAEGGPGSLTDAEASRLDAALSEVGPQVATRLSVLDVSGSVVADSPDSEFETMARELEHNVDALVRSMPAYAPPINAMHQIYTRFEEAQRSHRSVPRFKIEAAQTVATLTTTGRASPT